MCIQQYTIPFPHIKCFIIFMSYSIKISCFKYLSVIPWPWSSCLADERHHGVSCPSALYTRVLVFKSLQIGKIESWQPDFITSSGYEKQALLHPPIICSTNICHFYQKARAFPENISNLSFLLIVQIWRLCLSYQQGDWERGCPILYRRQRGIGRWGLSCKQCLP